MAGHQSGENVGRRERRSACVGSEGYVGTNRVYGRFMRELILVSKHIVFRNGW